MGMCNALVSPSLQLARSMSWQQRQQQQQQQQRQQQSRLDVQDQHQLRTEMPSVNLPRAIDELSDESEPRQSITEELLLQDDPCGPKVTLLVNGAHILAHEVLPAEVSAIAGAGPDIELTEPVEVEDSAPARACCSKWCVR